MIPSNPQPRYGSWIPASHVRLAGIRFALSLVVFLLSFLMPSDWPYAVRNGVMLFLLMFVVLTGHSMLRLRQMRRELFLDDQGGIAQRMTAFAVEPIQARPGDTILDIGCGSGASAILLAKDNPEATVVGIDPWEDGDPEESSLARCEDNARVEGVGNVRFQKGDAKALDFPDASFDAVHANLVFHNIPHDDRTELVRESLRVLKPGGLFSIQDLFGPPFYRDFDSFVDRLKREGITHVQLSPTLADRGILYPDEATQFGFQDAKRLSGIK